MLQYSATVDSAIEYGKQEQMDEWLHLYLNAEGENKPLSDGIKMCKRYFFSPAEFPTNLFKRCSGPEEEGLKFRVDKDWWAHKIAKLTSVVKEGTELPPIIVQYADGKFEVNDGNHRLKVYEDLGIEKAWVIIWITEEQELKEFMCKYGEYVKDCTIVQK